MVTEGSRIQHNITTIRNWDLNQESVSCRAGTLTPTLQTELVSQRQVVNFMHYTEESRAEQSRISAELQKKLNIVKSINSMKEKSHSIKVFKKLHILIYELLKQHKV